MYENVFVAHNFSLASNLSRILIFALSFIQVQEYLRIIENKRKGNEQVISQQRVEVAYYWRRVHDIYFLLATCIFTWHNSTTYENIRHIPYVGKCRLTLARVILYTAGHLHTAVPHCWHSRAPIVHTAVPRENNEHGCVYLRCRAVCKLPGCVEGHPWLGMWGSIGGLDDKCVELGHEWVNPMSYTCNWFAHRKVRICSIKAGGSNSLAAHGPWIYGATRHIPCLDLRCFILINLNNSVHMY